MKPTVGVPLCIRPAKEVQWELCGDLLWHASHRVARILGGRYKGEDFLGSIYVIYRRALDHWRPAMGTEFSTYFYTGLVRGVVRDFWRFDSMRASLYRRDKKEIECCTFGSNLHEATYFYHYRPPEDGEEWVAACLELFDFDRDALWNHMTRNLPPRHKEALSLHYRDGHPLRDAGARMNPPISGERVRQLVSISLHMMRDQTAKLNAVLDVFGVSLPPEKEQ